MLTMNTISKTCKYRPLDLGVQKLEETLKTQFCFEDVGNNIKLFQKNVNGTLNLIAWDSF